MLPTDTDIVALCAAVYEDAGAPVVVWDHYDLGLDDGVVWALKRLPDCDVVVFRGSTTFQDWLHKSLRSKSSPEEYLCSLDIRVTFFDIGEIHLVS